MVGRHPSPLMPPPPTSGPSRPHLLIQADRARPSNPGSAPLHPSIHPPPTPSLPAAPRPNAGCRPAAPPGSLSWRWRWMTSSRNFLRGRSGTVVLGPWLVSGV